MRVFLAVLFLACFFAGCVSDSQTPPNPSLPVPPPPRFSFREPINVTPPPPAPDQHGSEPSILASRKDGAIYIVSVLGSASARGDGLWKSTDAGVTWAWLGKPDYPFGGGDADLDEDAAGALYLPGQWRPYAVPGYYITGGESMAVSTDGGATWRTNPVASDLPVTDRQWTATHGTGNVWLSFNQAQRGLVVTHSTDGGLTWGSLQVVEGTWDPGDGVAVAGGPNGIPGDWAVDPEDGTLYLPYGPGIGGGSRDHRLFISKDGGQTFQEQIIHTAPKGEQAGAIFGSLALDTEGSLYYVWSEGVGGGREGMRVKLIRSRDGGTTWTQPADVSAPGTTAVFPWIVAGAAEKIAVAYYAANGSFLSDEAPAETLWYPTVSIADALDLAMPRFEVLPLTPTPNHKGPLCTGGTGCDPQYRLLGDFFEIALTTEGKVVAVWVDDTGAQRQTRFAHMDIGSLR